jgi:hypothetical protein
MEKHRIALQVAREKFDILTAEIEFHRAANKRPANKKP